MKIKLEQNLKNLDNVDLKQNVEGVEKPITLKDICINALMLQLEGDAHEGSSKASRYALGVKLYNLKEEAELTVEEISEIKKRVGKVPQYGPLIVGQCFNMLEGK